MRFIFLLISLYFFSCSDEHVSGSTSETQNAKIPLDSITYINDTMLSENIFWNMKVTDSLEINLYPPQLNKRLNYSELSESSAWNMSLIEKKNDTINQSLNKYKPKVFKVDTSMVKGMEYLNLELDFKWNNTNVIVDQLIPVFKKTLIDTIRINQRGTTWVISGPAYDNKVYASCDGSTDGSVSPVMCDTLRGANLCSDRFRILCQVSTNPLRPSYPIDEKGIKNHSPLYSQGWGGGDFDFTDEIIGDSLKSLENANQICRNYFGSQAKIAEYHQSFWHKDMTIRAKTDSSFILPVEELEEGGWGYWLGLTSSALTMSIPNIFEIRFWVAMNSQKANCWD